MILRKQERVRLARPARKILQLSSAYDATFVYLEVTKPGQSETIVHIDSKGVIIWETTFEDTLNQFCMVSDRELAVLDLPKQKVVLLNLQKRSIRTIDHLFLFDQTSQMSIQTFALTKYLAVVERGNSQDERMAITYFTAESGEYKLQAKYQSKLKEYRFIFDVNKANSHSMFIWYNPGHMVQLHLYVYDLKTNYNGQLRQIKIAHNLKNPFRQEAKKWSIFSAWESDSRKLMVSVYQFSQHEQVQLSNFIYSSQTGQLRQSYLKFRDKWEEKIVKCRNIGTFSFFYSYAFERGQPIDSPVFVVSNFEEKIIHEYSWKCTCQQHAYLPSYTQNLMIEAEFRKKNVKEINILQTHILVYKQVMVHFLLHLNQDFDDDLLKDATDLLETDLT